MGRILFVSLLLVFILSGVCHARTTESETNSDHEQASAEAQARELQKKMQNDNEAMDLVTALQDDPEVQAILNDPSAMKAVLSMDMNALDDDPRFKKLLDNPRVREILDLLRRLNQETE